MIVLPRCLELPLSRVGFCAEAGFDGIWAVGRSRVNTMGPRGVVVLGGGV
jgi:hypothetical protein